MRGVRMRAARPGDHAAIRALYPELAVPDPLPEPRAWERDSMATTLVAEAGGRLVGYALYKVLGIHGHVAQVVVAPERRRGGLGAAFMHQIARRLRAAGCTRWHLDVKEDNRAARALYEALGLEIKFTAQSLRVGAPAIAALPPARGARVSIAAEAEHRALESRFGLSPGALLRRPGVTLRVDAAGRAAGVARLSPASALAAPFRLRDHRVARPFFAAMQRWIDLPAVRVVIEGDPRLAELLCDHGAALEMRLLHMEGRLL
jgi:ribosomal-protein-alanine N-acetyltransferase